MLKYCSSPWTTVAIAGDGSVNPCLCQNWHTLPPIGNMMSQSLRSIFHSPKIQYFRNTIIDQSFQHCKPSCAYRWNLDNVDQFPDHSTVELPTHVMLAIDMNCNLKCASCRNNNIYSNQVNSTAWKILETLIQDYQDIKIPTRIQCDGSGDIFASAAYRQFFMHSSLPQCFVFALTTNGNLLTKNRDIIEKLSSKISTVEVSFDAGTEDTYKAVRGGNFNLVQDGVRMLVNMGIKTNLQFVVQKRNYHEILDYLLLARELGVDHVGLQHINRWYHMSDAWWTENQLRDNAEVDLDRLRKDLEIFKLADRTGICGGLEDILHG